MHKNAVVFKMDIVIYTEVLLVGRTLTNVDRTCGPTHLLVFSGNKICLNYIY